MKPQLTPAEKERIARIYRQLPQGLRKLGNEGERAIDRLMEKGVSFDEAEQKVITRIEGAKHYIQNGQYDVALKSVERLGR